MSKIINKYEHWLEKKVACYFGNERIVGLVIATNEDSLYIESKDGTQWWSAKQCRLLKKKQKSIMWVRKGDLISEEIRMEMNWPAGDLVRIKIIK